MAIVNLFLNTVATCEEVKNILRLLQYRLVFVFGSRGAHGCLKSCQEKVKKFFQNRN